MSESQLAPVDVKTGVCEECGLIVTEQYCFDCGIWVCEDCWGDHDFCDEMDYDPEDDLGDWPDDMGHSLDASEA